MLSQKPPLLLCPSQCMLYQQLQRTLVISLQMKTSAARPTTDTRHFCCLACFMESQMPPGSQLDKPANRKSTCISQ